MHKQLREEHPDAVLDRSVWEGQIRVKTEIYDGSLTRTVLDMLDALAPRGQAA